jgi:hypothetical protein
MQLRCEGVLLQTQQGEANVRKRSWNGDGKETNGHSGTCQSGTLCLTHELNGPFFCVCRARTAALRCYCGAADGLLADSPISLLSTHGWW